MKREESSLTNLTKLYLLVALKKPMHGYELMKDFEAKSGKRLSPGQLYPLLSQLTKKKLLSKQLEYIGNRRRYTYSLTRRGERFRENLLRQLQDILKV